MSAQRCDGLDPNERTRGIFNELNDRPPPDSDRRSKWGQREGNQPAPLMVRYAIGTPLDEQIPATVLEHLANLDALHETACDAYDVATRDRDATRKALTDAAAALTDAEEEWSMAGRQMDTAARAVSFAREAAGLVFTASGYRKRKPDERPRSSNRGLCSR